MASGPLSVRISEGGEPPLPSELGGPAAQEEERPGFFAGTSRGLCAICAVVAALAVIVTLTHIDVEEGLTTAVIKAATRGRENDTSRSTILAPTLQETEIVPTKTTMSVITNAATGSSDTSTTLRSTHPPSTAESTHTPSSPPIHADKLVCTVGKTVTNESKYPEDRLCDYIFFESLSREQRIDLTAYIIDRHVKSFLKHQFKVTQKGMSFSVEDDSLFVDYRAPGFTQSLDVLWQSGVYHFGMLNIYGPKARTDLPQIMNILQVMYSATVDSVPDYDRHTRSYRRVHTVVGLAADFKFEYGVIAEALRHFVPSLIILHTHVSFADQDRPDCRILPASMLGFPVDIPRDDFGYGTSVEEAASFAQSLRRMGVPVTISFTMRARIYAARDISSDGNLINQLFKPCSNYYGSTNVFVGHYCGVFGAATFRYLPGVEATFAFKTGRFPQIITFETEGVLIRKVCAAAQYLGFPFPVAVYDVDKDNEGDFDCTAWNISRKSFSRLDVLGKLRELGHGTQYYATDMCVSIFHVRLTASDIESKEWSHRDSVQRVGEDDEKLKLSSTLDPPSLDAAPHTVVLSQTRRSEQRSGQPTP